MMAANLQKLASVKVSLVEVCSVFPANSAFVQSNTKSGRILFPPLSTMY